MDVPSFCISCGHRHPPGARFCEACGRQANGAARGPEPRLRGRADIHPIVSAILTGDWVGAVRTSAAAAGVMLALAALATGVALGFSEVPGNPLTWIGQLLTLAVGGSVSLTAEADLGFGGLATSLGGEIVLVTSPLLLPLAGFTTLAVLHIRRLRATRAELPQVVAQSARVWLLLCAFALVGALLVRSEITLPSGLLPVGSATASVRGGIGGALLGTTLWTTVTLASAVIWRLPDVLPHRIRRVRELLGGAVAGSLLGVALACAGLLVYAAAYGGIAGGSGDLPSTPGAGVALSAVAIVLWAPNLLLLALGLASGSPVTVSAAVPVQGTSEQSISLIDAATDAPGLWAGPFVVGAAMLIGGVVAALHHRSSADARRYGLLMAPVLGIVYGSAAVLSGVSLDGTALGTSIGFAAHLGYLAAALAGLVWGGLAGLAGAVLAPGLPASTISGVRRHILDRRRAASTTAPGPDTPGAGRR